MFVYILDKNFENIGLVDVFKSIIWTDRYQEAGDFELACSPDPEIMNHAQIDYYAVNPESEHVMIIEGREVDTDAEDGNQFVVTGRSLESILERRIVWKQTTISGSLQNGIKQLLMDAFIEPEDPDRKIENFIFEESDDPAITELTLEAQYTGDNIYDIVKSLCAENEIGFRIFLDSENRFVFRLYKGVDRSYAQDANPYVVFSPGFDNIINSQYAETVRDYKNVAWVGGEGEGTSRKFAQSGSASGVSRREVFVDARDVSSENENGSAMTKAEYNAALQNRGTKELSARPWAKSFEGEVDATNGFVYGTDFYLGDMVQVANEYGMEGPSLVSEMVWAQDEEGYSCYPTFVAQNDNEKEEETA